MKILYQIQIMMDKSLDLWSFDTNTNTFDSIKKYRLKNTNKVFLAHLNINSTRNKFTCLKELISANIDVLIIEETKFIKLSLRKLL